MIRSVKKVFLLDLFERMMAPSFISYIDVQIAIEEIFPNPSNLKWQLTPDQIHNLAAQAGVELIWEKVPNWDSFEYGYLEIPQSTFAELLVSDDCSRDELLWLVTDEMFSEGKERALEIQVQDFPAFVKEGYREMYHIAELFYAADVIIVFPGRLEIAMLHHSGFIATYRKQE